MQVKCVMQFFKKTFGEYENKCYGRVELIDECHELWKLRIPGELLETVKANLRDVAYMDLVNCLIDITPYTGKDGKTYYNTRLEGLTVVK